MLLLFLLLFCVFYSYKYSEEVNTQVLELKHHLDAVRGVLFAPDGQSTFVCLMRLSFGWVYMLVTYLWRLCGSLAALYTASADKSIRAFDTLGNVTWAELRAHECVHFPV